MSKHTPGPWTYDEDASEILSGSEASGWIWIADVAHSVPTGETQANARLIASAPDLLRACKMVADMAVSWEALTPGDISEVKAAITKAEGK